MSEWTRFKNCIELGQPALSEVPLEHGKQDVNNRNDRRDEHL